ncbi:MAG: HYC_CC_PP family protein [Bacteroidia bacterium]
MKKTFAILLALVITTLSLNVGLAYHYCGGSLAEIKLFVGYGEAGCGMEHEETGECSTHDNISSPTCCQNYLQQVETDDYPLLKKPVELQSPVSYLVSLVCKVVFGQEFVQNQLIFIKSPPGVTAVSLPLIQVFLI